MAVIFVDFTDNDGVVWKINPERVVSIRVSPTVAGKNVIDLQDGTHLLSPTQSLATTTAVFASPTPKYARISLTALGDTTLVAAVPGKKIRLVGYSLTSQLANAAVTFRFKSGAVTILGGHLELDGIFPITYTGNSFEGVLETAVGEALVANLSAAKAVEGHLTYVEV